MRIQRFKRHTGGFTLIETMIASIILLLAIGSSLAVVGRGFRYLSDLRRYARSSQVLQQKMEDVRLITQWNTLMALNNTNFVDIAAPGLPCNGSIKISSYPPYTTDTVAMVTITVTWTNSVYKTLTNRISTLVCKNGLNKYIF
jgi:Tfp pilus assembly protein PilV